MLHRGQESTELLSPMEHFRFPQRAAERKGEIMNNYEQAKKLLREFRLRWGKFLLFSP